MAWDFPLNILLRRVVVVVVVVGRGQAILNKLRPMPLPIHT